MRYAISPKADIHKMIKNDEELKGWVRKRVWGGWHAAGTCRIGADDDPRAVVDPSCRVHGVEGLRVADASIMPTVVSANTNVTAIMIGEKAADIVLNE